MKLSTEMVTNYFSSYKCICILENLMLLLLVSLLLLLLLVLLTSQFSLVSYATYPKKENFLQITAEMLH